MMKRISRYGLLLLATMCLFALMGGSVWAATFPSYERLLEVSPIEIPTKVAADSAGNVYVGQSSPYTSVLKYSVGGNLVETISLGLSATALKVSDSGLLYVGQAGKIGIYNGRTLINTITGVSSPVAIDIASNGNIYVADAGTYRIKVFDSSGNLQFTIGDYQVFGRNLIGIVLDEANNELYALDRGEILTDGSGVWRVQVFDLSGTKLRSFSHYGYLTDGMLAAGSSIAVDEQQRVYVSDNLQDIIGVFDSTGNYLGTMYDLSAPFYSITNMTYKNNRLYWVSFMTNKATVVGIDGYAGISVTPASISLNAQGSNVSGSSTITISNTGRGDLNWTALSDTAWLGVTSASGIIGAGMQGIVDVTVNSAGLEQGEHTGAVTFASNGGSVSVAVSVNVVTPPALVVSPSVINIQAKVNDAVPSNTVSIDLSNDISGSLTWQASSDSSWLSISPASGASNTITAANVAVNTAGLAAGAYTGKITVDAGSADGSPAQVIVNLQLISSNSIHVVTNNADAAFSISGAQAYSGSGTDWTVNSVPDGSYTIVYNSVQGYITPASETKSVSGGSVLEFSGNYQQIKAENIVATLEDYGRTAITARIYDSNGAMLKEFAAAGKGLDNAVADLTGDGSAEIVTGLIKGDSFVEIFNQGGVEMTRFLAFPGKKGIRLAADDLNGDGFAEIIVSPNNGAPQVRALDYTNGSIVSSGIDFAAYSSSDLYSSRMVISSGDTDGDGRNEIITAVSNGSTGFTLVRIWEVDTSGGIGNWTVSLKNEIRKSIGNDRIVAMTAGDINSDGADEILIASNDGTVTSLSGADSNVILSSAGITDIAVGDVHGSGDVNIVAGLSGGMVKIFAVDGTELSQFKAFDTTAGVRISLGVIGY